MIAAFATLVIGLHPVQGTRTDPFAAFHAFLLKPVDARTAFPTVLKATR